MVAAEPHGTRQGTEAASEEIADDTYTRRRSARRGETVRDRCRQDRFPGQAGTDPSGAFGHVDVDGIEVPQGDGHTALNPWSRPCPAPITVRVSPRVGHHLDR